MLGSHPCSIMLKIFFQMTLNALGSLDKPFFDINGFKDPSTSVTGLKDFRLSKTKKSI